MARTDSAASVGMFFDRLSHPRKKTIVKLREAILAVEPSFGEEIKWNAPSFVYGGEHRLTMRIQPKDIVQLIFHRGAKARPVVDLRSTDVTGRIKWAAPDRGVLDIIDDDPLLAGPGALQQLIRQWMEAAEAADRQATEGTP